MQQESFNTATAQPNLVMSRLSLILMMILISTGFVMAQKIKTDRVLQEKLEALVKDFHGTAGIYVEQVKTGRIAAVNADTIFPTASIVKVPILVGIFDKIAMGDLTYNQPLVYDTARKRGGSGLVQYFQDSSSTSLDVLISLMIGYSDNIAATWCQELAGGGQSVNTLMEKMGFKDTRVNSKTPGRAGAYATYGWGQTTPREMARLLLLIRQGKAVDPVSSDCMYRQMSHVFYDGYALSQIPPYIQTASKQGMVNASRSELVMVNAPHGDYVFYVATKNNQDQRWEKDNEAWNLARKVSGLLWHYFEPKDKWKPGVNASNLTP